MRRCAAQTLEADIDAGDQCSFFQALRTTVHGCKAVAENALVTWCGPVSRQNLCSCVQEISVAPAPAASSSGGKLQWQRIINQPLKLKASVDYDEARHRVIR